MTFFRRPSPPHTTIDGWCPFCNWRDPWIGTTFAKQVPTTSLQDFTGGVS